MATINHSAGADIIVPSNNGTTYRGLGGDDTYILSNSIAANAAITIVDTSGANKIQLVDGLSVASMKFAADAVQLTLGNGAVVTINGASNFDFDLGGNATAGTSGSVTSFAGFAAGAGVATLPASGTVDGASNVSVTGSSWSGGAATYTYTVSKDANQISEGESVTYTVTASSAVTADTSLTWTAIGSDNGGTVDKATATDIDAQSGTVTIPAGSTSATFSVTAVADSIAEGIEGLQVSVFSPESATVGTSTVLLNNSGASASAQTFEGTSGVNNFVGASGADSFDFSTSGELNDVDTLDGGAGSDILSLTNGAATLTPNIENIETINITPTGTLVVNLANTESTFDSIKAVSDGGNALTVNDVAVIPGKVGITNGSGALTVNLKAAAVAGASDNIAIELAGSTTGADVAITDDSATGIIESASINSISAANTLTTLALNGAKSLTITGDQSLTLTQALEATVATVDASGMTGAVGLTMSADPAASAVTAITITGSAGVDSLRGTAAGADNISAGGGNDTITFASDGQLTSKDVVDGGDGVDTVVSAENAIVSSQLGGLSNVEKLSQTGTGTITLTENINPTTIVIGDASNQTVAFNDDYDQATTVSIMGDTGSADTITNNSNIALTVSAYSTDLSAADGSTTVNETYAAGDTTLTVADSTGMTVGTTLTIGTEKLAVTGVTNSTTVTVTRGIQDTTDQAHASGTAITFDTDSSLTITGSATATDALVIYANGDGNIDTNGTNTITSIDTITINSMLGVTGAYSAATQMDMGTSNTPVTVTSNLSALDGTLELDFSGYSLASAAASGAVTYIGGDNVDIIHSGSSADNITSGAGNDIIHLTSGNNTVDTGTGVDTVYLGSGVDNISAGAGNDIISAGATDLLANDIIDGGEGTDQLTFSATGYTDESVFGGLTNIESIKGDAANGVAQALPFNANTSFSIIDASGAGDTDLTLSVGYTQDTTVKLGATDLVNADNIINGGATGANVNLTVTAQDQGSFDTDTVITGGTGTDTITLTNVADTNVSANDHMVLTNATSIDVLNIVDYTNGIDTTVTAGTNGAVRTPMTVNATTLDAGETLDFDGNAMTSPLTINSGEGADSLDGGTDADVIYGNGGIDRINGQENSAVYGADALYGGAGNDIITVDVESEFSNSSTTALVTDTVDGGAGTDTLAFSAAATLTKAELANISNVEKLTLADTSSITLSDDFLTNNPGVSITLAAGTISAGAGTTADPTITEAVTYTAGNGNIKITTGTGDDTFATASGALINVSDTIDGGAGTDTIAVYNDATFGTTDVAGDAVTLALDIYHTNIEKITVVDVATDDTADVTITIAAAYTGTALEIDGSALDQNALSTANEALIVTQNTADLAALTVTGGAGADIITTGAKADHITGNGGIDTIVTSAGDDSIYGGAGNDIITPGAGKDYVEGGAGNDTFVISVDADFEVSGGTETLDGGAGTDTLSFTEAGARDISAAEMGSVKNIEVISIGSGTGAAATVIGLGDAFFSNNNDAVSIIANPTTNTAATTKIDGSSVSSGAITLTLKGNITATNDTLIGGAGDDTLIVGYKGLAAATTVELEATDVFTGNGGTDTIVLDTQADGSTGGAGAITVAIDFDTVTGVEKLVVRDADGATTAADLVTVNLAASVTTANVPAAFEVDGSVKTDADDDLIFNYTSAGTADNSALTTVFTLTGGAGDDTLYGAAGADIINGGSGADALHGFGQSDIITGGAGADLIDGGDETALTGVGDNLSGDAGADTINGGAGADTIDGGDGADIITGGTGADIITGGGGADVFEIDTWAESGGTSIDTITDFTSGSDVIKITISAAQIETAFADAAGAFTATDLGDVSTFAEVEAILTNAVMGQPVYVSDTNQLVIDANGDANINASDFRINLTGTTGYDDKDVVYYITADADTARTYTLGDGADSFTGGAVADTIIGNGGADTITGGGGADIITGGAGNDNITGGAGVDVMTGGAGNDIIVTTDAEADVVSFVAPTTASPYVSTQNGTDTITMFVDGAAGNFEFDWDNLSDVSGNGGTDDHFDLVSANGTADAAGAVVNALAAGTSGDIAVAGKIIVLDTGAGANITASTVAGYFEGTGTELSLTANNSAIVITGDNTGADIQVWWVDNAVDGDGSDVTTADVHLLAESSGNFNVNNLYADQLDQGL